MTFLSLLIHRLAALCFRAADRIDDRARARRGPSRPMPNLTPEQERRIAEAPARPWKIPDDIDPIY